MGIGAAASRSGSHASARTGDHRDAFPEADDGRFHASARSGDHWLPGVRGDSQGHPAGRGSSPAPWMAPRSGRCRLTPGEPAATNVGRARPERPFEARYLTGTRRSSSAETPAMTGRWRRVPPRGAAAGRRGTRAAHTLIRPPREGWAHHVRTARASPDSIDHLRAPAIATSAIRGEEGTHERPLSGRSGPTGWRVSRADRRS